MGRKLREVGLNPASQLNFIEDVMHQFNWKAFKILIDNSEKSISIIADELETSVPNIHNWKNGTAQPSTQHLASIAEYFKIKIDDLLIKPEDFKFTEAQIAESQG